LVREKESRKRIEEYKRGKDAAWLEKKRVEKEFYSPPYCINTFNLWVVDARLDLDNSWYSDTTYWSFLCMVKK
jgi:hypothetical protein